MNPVVRASPLTTALSLSVSCSDNGKPTRVRQSDNDKEQNTKCVWALIVSVDGCD